MTLITEEVQKQLPALYSLEHDPDPLARVRFYDALGDWSWYATEFDGENLFFGVVLGFERELGYFSLAEFEEVNKSAGFERIRRDPSFTPTPVSKVTKPD
jgi:hypothetical protein